MQASALSPSVMRSLTKWGPVRSAEIPAAATAESLNAS